MLDRMRKRSSRFVHAFVLALIAVLMFEGSAIAEGSTSGSGRPQNSFVQAFAIGFDVVVLRPLAAVTVVVGTALFVPAALIALVGGKGSKERVSEATELFVTEPFEEAFRRPLGDF